MGEEIRLHLEMQAEVYRNEGMEPAAAADRARREFGHLDGIKETCRDERAFPWISQLGQDLRYGLRMLRRSPGFTTAAVLTLALGIGVNTAFFSLADQILLRRLPVSDPGKLVLFHWAAKQGLPIPTSGSWENDPVTKQVTCTSFSTSTFELFRKQNRTLAGVFAFAPISRITLVSDGQADLVGLGEMVSGDFFPVLGVVPAAGRLIGGPDQRRDAPAVAVISFRYWQRRFGGDPSVVGKSVQVNRVPVTIIGVSPRPFAGTLEVGDNPDIYLPLSLSNQLGVTTFSAKADESSFWWVQIMGRQAPGVPLDQVRANLEGAFQQSTLASLAAVGAPRPGPGDPLPTLIAGPGGQGLNDIRHRFVQELSILSGLAVTVLAIACANLANLLLARGASRQREIGVRLAMGAGRGRVFRQLLTESMLLAVLGGAAAVPFSVWAEGTLVSIQPTTDGHRLMLEPALDLHVFAAAAGFSVATALIFGLLPAVRATRVNISEEFQGGSRTLGGPRSLLGQSLIVVQVALSVVLLVGAGLFGRTLRNLDHVDTGFSSEGLLLFELNPNPGGSSFSAGAAEERAIAERLRALPGVNSAAFSKVPLLSNAGWNSQFGVPGRPKAGDAPDSAMVNAVSGDFFSTYGIRLVAGRALDANDSMHAPSVAVINQAFSKGFFGAEDPLGRVIVRQVYGGKAMTLEIVGVSSDAMYSEVRSPAPPTVYLPFRFPQANASAEATFAVRTSGDPLALVASVREVVRSVDARLPLGSLRTQEAQIAELSANERMFAWLSGLFGVFALCLVALGLYGLLSYNVLRRTGEIGLRMALGANSSGVLWMVLRASMSVVAVGIVLGLFGAFAATRIVANLLYGLTATDPASFAGGILVLLAVACVACWMPARRASMVDPMVALRYE